MRLKLMTQSKTLDDHYNGDQPEGPKMENRTTTEWLDGDEPLFPHRRDVRDMAEEVLHALLVNYDEDEEEFDRDFLTGVRDLMREGVPFEDAVGSFASFLVL